MELSGDDDIPLLDPNRLTTPRESITDIWVDWNPGSSDLIRYHSDTGVLTLPDWDPFAAQALARPEGPGRPRRPAWEDFWNFDIRWEIGGGLQWIAAAFTVSVIHGFNVDRTGGLLYLYPKASRVVVYGFDVSARVASGALELPDVPGYVADLIDQIGTDGQTAAPIPDGAGIFKATLEVHRLVLNIVGGKTYLRIV